MLPFTRPIATAWYAGPANPHLALATFAPPKQKAVAKAARKTEKGKKTPVIKSEFEYHAKSCGNSRYSATFIP